ncbi:hypothetical protein D3C84_115970 [compost metagenome]
MIRSKFYKKVFSVLFFSIIGFSVQSQTNKEFHSWAPTPPMGWNSWDCYGPTVTEAEVKANADCRWDGTVGIAMDQQLRKQR